MATFVSVVIPAYNEELVIAATLRGISEVFLAANISAELVVVDDGSSDATSRIANATELLNLRVLRHDQRKGKGAAIRTGLSLATGSIAGFTDADLPVPAADLLRVVTACGQQGDVLAVGKRDRCHKNSTRAPRTRRAVSDAVRRSVALLHPQVAASDPWCPVKFGTAALMKEVGRRARCDGYFFDLELLREASGLGATILELPVEWSDRRGQIEWSRILVNLMDAARCVAGVAEPLTSAGTPTCATPSKNGCVCGVKLVRHDPLFGSSATRGRSGRRS